MSQIDPFLADAASFLGMTQGEVVTITPKVGSVLALTDVVVLRDPLNTRVTDDQQRPRYGIELLIPMAEYPAAGVAINLSGDTATIALRRGGTVKTTRRIAALLGQVNGMWHVGLES